MPDVLKHGARNIIEGIQGRARLVIIYHALHHKPDSDATIDRPVKNHAEDAARAEANAVINAAINGKLPLSRGGFELVFRRVLATADSGHTNLGGGSGANRVHRLPMRVYSLADDVFVLHTLPRSGRSIRR